MHDKTLPAQQYFPRGLYQPSGSFRFSIDALLLASFLLAQGQKTHSMHIADLGTGCGIISLAMLLQLPHAKSLGIDNQQQLLDAAQINAQTLGVSNRFSTFLHDIEAPIPTADATKVPAQFYDMVAANPPYRVLGTGRLPTSVLRRNALFGSPQLLTSFALLASYLLAPHGTAGFIYPYDKRAELIQALQSASLHVSQQFFIYPHENKPPKLVIIEAKHLNTSVPCQERTLILYEGNVNEQHLTSAALNFCPLLACNAQVKV